MLLPILILTISISVCVVAGLGMLMFFDVAFNGDAAQTASAARHSAPGMPSNTGTNMTLLPTGTDSGEFQISVRVRSLIESTDEFPAVAKSA